MTIFAQDAKGRFQWFVNLQSIWASQDLVGKTDADVFDAESVAAFQRAKERAGDGGTRQTVELSPRTEIIPMGAQCHLKVSVEPLTGANGAIEGYLCSSMDTTLEKQREATLKTLLLEVSHRSKNMLAMVLGLSAQTARSARSIDGFLRAFTGRVQSLSKSQDVITDSDWRGARFRELVDHQVINVVQLGGARIEVSGDDPNLRPNAGLHIGLALHELVTNALVHGALVQTGGNVKIRCEVIHSKSEPPVARITWHERSAAQPSPTHNETSFGKTMLERIVPRAVDGSGTLELRPDGVVYTLTVAGTQFH
ncbi:MULTISPECIES: PAS domain-containing sensor histidine kinase [unclassified Roseitalea]|uniref:PAS domain-containing sensor histidine kinase n=1 Tax=unclassified Roseitalea TaxID=2639107 RepID=UPI00273F3B27|nr:MULTISPECIES: PAS domain-containing sensor histidine kinase [unclassified Roseitalea]